jgi:hypothetical protein
VPCTRWEKQFRFNQYREEGDAFATPAVIEQDIKRGIFLSEGEVLQEL